MDFADPDTRAPNAGWTFEGIEDSFDEHIARSIPLYHEGHGLVCQLSDFFLSAAAVVTEIGTATGALAARFLEHNAARTQLRFFGMDRVPGMIARASQRCQTDPRATFETHELRDYRFPRSDMILSYYTLQFLHPRERQDIVDRIYEALHPGGAFVLFEKVRAPDARFQDVTVQLYQEFKLLNELSESQILNKQRSLKGVLEPLSSQGNLDLLRQGGFTQVMTVMKWICFEGFVAVK